MRRDVRLGRVGGVEVRAHLSAPVVLVVLAVAVAHERLPVDVPGRAPWLYALCGALTAVGLTMTVLGHEAAHAAAGRRAGMVVQDITLSWAGGATRLREDGSTPLARAGVAMAGPLASAATGTVLLAAGAVSATGVAHACLRWLGAVNLGLAVVNALPAAPLDGGRALQALLWARWHDRWRAARVAATAGRVLGAAVLATALATSLRPAGQPAALVLALVGCWLYGAALAEGRVARVQCALQGRRVDEVMRPVAAAPGWVSVAAFAAGPAASRPAGVWLLDAPGGGCSGVVTAEAVHAVRPGSRAVVPLAALAVAPEHTAGARTGDDLAATMARTGGQRVVLVVEAGATVGAVVPSDVEALVGGRRGRMQVPGAPSGVKGFDFGRQTGRSEPWSPDPR